jgi:curved DNA-binding protein CbpA
VTQPPAEPDFDPYKTLQVDSEADQEVIQAAFRRLAQKWHPDVASGPEAAARMTAINRAWGILQDPDRRAAYDRARTGRPRPAATAAPSAGDASPSSTLRPDPGLHRPVGPQTVAPPPPGQPSGSTLNFGRYNGWTLGEVARADIEYIEWLDRTPIGRPYRDEIDAILRSVGRRKSAEIEAKERRGLYRPR